MKFHRTILVGVSNRRPVEIEIKMETKPTVSPHLDVDGRTVPEIVELSMVGAVWQSNRRDWESGGQNCDEIASLFPDNAALQALVAIWKRWHLNGMIAGSRAQRAAIEAHEAANPEWRYDYTQAEAILAAQGLNPDASVGGYRYGHSWLCEELPQAVQDDVQRLSVEAECRAVPAYKAARAAIAKAEGRSC